MSDHRYVPVCHRINWSLWFIGAALCAGVICLAIGVMR
jgi:hypothetical protein